MIKKISFKKCIKISIFILIFAILLMINEKIFMPKQYYPSSPGAYIGRTIKGFYNLPNNSLQYVIIGTSKTSRILPLEIYDEYKIIGYNLSTTGQPMLVSLYLLKELLKTQKPKVVVLEASKLFGEYDIENYRRVLNCLELSKNKIDMIYDMLKINDKCENLLSGLSYIYKYHSRWADLDRIDFVDCFLNKKNFLYGANVEIGNKPARYNLADINNIAKEMYESNKYIVSEDKKFNENINKDSLEYVKKIKQICDDNNIKLLLIESPSMLSPDDAYAVTLNKHNKIKDIANKLNVNYLEFMYDNSIDIDWQNDTTDEGMHLNIAGAIKVSNELGKYLNENYNLNIDKNNELNKELEKYIDLKNVSLIRMQNKIDNYFDFLSNSIKDKLIIISVNENVEGLFLDEFTKYMKSIGSTVLFPSDCLNSYIFVMNDGKKIYEKIDDIKLHYNKKIKKAIIDVISYGYRHTAKTKNQISINNKNWIANQKGINVVVYDSKKNIVLDSIAFNFDKKTNRITSLRNKNCIGIAKYIFYLHEGRFLE